MSIRSDLFKRLQGEPTEKIPWFGDLSYWYFALKQQGKLDPQYFGNEGEIRFYKDQKVGHCFLYDVLSYKTEFLGDVSFEEKVTAQGIYSTYHTKYGDLTSVQTYSPANFSYAHTKHMVETAEDLQIMAYIFENMKYTPDYERFHHYDNLIGEDGILVEILPVNVSAVQKLMARWAGVETTVELYYDETDIFEECVDRIQEAQMPVFDILAASGAQLAEWPENLSSDVTGNLFDKYNVPYYKQVNEILHRAGKYTAIHIDGRLNPCLGKLHDAGFDIAEAVTPSPLGDIELEDLRKAAGEEILIWGGLPGGLFSPSVSDAEFEAYVQRILNLNDQKMVLGVADQVPPDAVEGRVREVSRLIGRG